MTSPVLTANPNHPSLNSSSVEVPLSSMDLDGPKIITEVGKEKPKTYGESLTQLLIDNPEWAKGRLQAIAAWSKRYPDRPHPIILVNGKPQWLNRKQRRKLENE